MSVKTLRQDHVDDPGRIAQLWRIYVTAFEKSRVGAVQDQLCYDRQGFEEALRDRDYQKFIVMCGAEEVGLGLATNDMEKARVAYVNPHYLSRSFPQEHREGRLWYFTSIAVDPHLQGQGLFFASMAEEMTAFIDSVDGIVLFDYSLETNPALPKLLTTVIERAQKKRGLSTSGTEFTELGGQAYGCIRFTSDS